MRISIRLLPLLAVLLASVATEAGAQAETIASADAGKHVGKRVTVCGDVVGTAYLENTATRPTMLNFDKPYPDHLFTVVIFQSARKQFPNPPEVVFLNKKVCVTGTVALFKGSPQIVLTDPASLKVAAR